MKESSPRPTTGQNSMNSAKSPQQQQQQQQQQTTPNSGGGNAGGVRDSVMKRFSLLRGVGRKGSRLDFKTDTHGPVVHEE